MSNPKFKQGEIVLYQKGDTYQLGEIKRVIEEADSDGNIKYKYFVFYHTGDTPALTNEDQLHKIDNYYAFDIRRKKWDEV